MGYRLRKAANCKPREKGSASWLYELFWVKCASCDRLLRWVSGPLAPLCTPQEPHIASLAFALQFHPSVSSTAALEKTRMAEATGSGLEGGRSGTVQIRLCSVLH